MHASHFTVLEDGDSKLQASQFFRHLMQWVELPADSPNGQTATHSSLVLVKSSGLAHIQQSREVAQPLQAVLQSLQVLVASEKYEEIAEVHCDLGMQASWVEWKTLPASHWSQVALLVQRLQSAMQGAQWYRP